MMKKLLLTTAAAGVFFAPLAFIGKTATGPGPARDLDDAVAQARATGLQGAELATWCARLCNKQFELQTKRTPWENAATAFARRRGNSATYNGALAEILGRLGLDARLVFAARTRRETGTQPWFATSHAWVDVEIDGRRRPLCARFGPFDADALHEGQAPVIPVTDVHPVRMITIVDNAILNAIVSAGMTWSCWRRNVPYPLWLESRF